MSKAEEQRRRKSLRLPSWDYTFPAWYFITICTHNRDPFFGRVHDATVIRSPLGDIARDHWLQIPRQALGINPDEFVIMPNHLHGIIIITSPGLSTSSINGPRPPESRVGALHATPLPINRNTLSISQKMSDKSPKAGSLGVVIRSYKSSVARWARRHGFPDFAWQRGYYDHIIRDEIDLSRICRYIRRNPLEWSLDPYHYSD